MTTQCLVHTLQWKSLLLQQHFVTIRYIFTEIACPKTLFSITVSHTRWNFAHFLRGDIVHWRPQASWIIERLYVLLEKTLTHLLDVPVTFQFSCFFKKHVILLATLCVFSKKIIEDILFRYFASNCSVSKALHMRSFFFVCLSMNIKEIFLTTSIC